MQFQDAEPVGTGPYEVYPCNPNNITYTANTDYWQPGLPHCRRSTTRPTPTTSPANLDLANGKAQWGGQFIPGVDKSYIAKDPENHHIWFPPTTNVEPVFNIKHRSPAT